jgi:hypothetical protein
MTMCPRKKKTEKAKTPVTRYVTTDNLYQLLSLFVFEKDLTQLEGDSL